MKTSWAKNLYDYEGDKYDECILLFCDDSVILKFKHLEELKEFVNSINRIVEEIPKYD